MVGRGRPPPPPQVARDEGIRPRRRNMEDEENMYGKLKFNMPKFKGEDDAEAYLSWALKVDKIFRIHNYSGAKKVAMASLEFEDYANTWWEQVVTLREEKGDPPIDTWEDMKEEMQARFVPTHYKTDLFNKLQKLKQGTKTVEEFFKEMELTMMRANIQESENQTIARFFNGLNYPIKKIVEFQPYSNMVELVHQASKAERQVNEDIKYSKSKQYFASKLATSTPTTSVKPSASSTPSKQPSIQSRMKQTVSSTASSKASTGPSNVTCFKCGTQGHKSFECKNTKVMITMENGDIETLSEGEYEALVQAAVANEEDYDEESGEDPLLCTHDPSPSLVVTRVLTTQPQAMEDQRCNIFQTRAGIGGKSIKVIIDGGSCHNLASTELCEKLNLTLRKHPHPYHVQWLSDKGNVKIQHTVTVNFKIGPYEDTVECDVVPMTVCHMLLGRPWQFDKKASSCSSIMDRSGDETRDGEVLRSTERLATQHNLWIQRQEFKEQLSLFETRIDEQYEEVAHNFSTVNQDLALLREATDNLNGQMAANDANMERRMDNLERAITNLGPPPQGMKTIIVLIDHMLVKKTLALTQGEVNSIAMLVLMNDLHKNKLLTKIVIKRLAMPTMGMTTIPKTTSTTTWRHMVMLPPKVVKSNQGVISGIILAMTKGAEGNHNMIKMREP
ncbi:hypothetical protein QYE76_017175 [Lolium multiflorum]|uniref:CCHC-type domain-containing protein n=1 Tax=Lolium multiflorum TaxID=4521 RepID=A0AAD8VC30_LOLMU|nr:hypothetical protein QYE76_017175 [Lolium multiflorum]